MELHQLRYLRSVVRTGSVTAAAEAEHVAQPSVSKQMRLLERELGVPLFHRVGRRVVPTDAAVELAECAGRVLDDISATTTAVASPGSQVAGSLRIAATETVTNHLLPAALTALRASHHAANIRVEMLGTDDVIARVLADEVDFGVVVLPIVDSRLEIHPLFTEHVLLALPPAHAWSRRTAVPITGVLRSNELLLSMPGHGLRAQIDEAAQARGVDLVPGIELRSQQALLAMVAAGGGIALAPLMSVREREDVAAVPLEPPLSRELGWIKRRGRHVPPIGLLLLDMVRAAGVE